MTAVALVGLVALLSGCATLNEGECRRGDWYQIGRADGARGEPSAYLAEHHEACAEYGVAPDPAAWEQGRVHGLAAYCTRVGGLRAGRQGGSYRHVCPPGAEAEFLAGYEVGRVIHDYRSRIDRLRGDISSNDRQLAKKDLADDRRRDLRERNRHLSREILALEVLLSVQEGRAGELER